jgi:thymidylate kinase
MSTSAKKKEEAPKSKSRKGKSKDEPEAAPRGRLIALEGTRGKDLSESVARLARYFVNGSDSAGWSRWDASNTFYEMRQAKTRSLMPPPRAMLLLYASDLMFRLRWEIVPALEEGRTVLAAPYVESAIAVGVALGLSKDWLDELFSFAPKPDAVLRLKEKLKAKGKTKKGKGKSKAKKKAPKMEAGFVEYCCNALAATSPDWDPAEVRSGALRYLESLEENHEIQTVGKKPPKHLLKDG